MCIKNITLASLSALIFSALMLMNPARAAIITFDDIPYVPVDPDWPQFDDVLVTDQYLSLGLLIEGGFLGRRYPPEDNLDNPQFLFGSNFMRMRFVGNQLPTYVTMTISSVIDYANIINFYSPDGHLFEMVTSGYAGIDSNNPYRPDQPIAFSSPSGISEITFEGYLNMRWGTLVDNLKFKSSPQTTVPEPQLFILLCLGLSLLGLSRQGKIRSVRMAPV